MFEIKRRRALELSVLRHHERTFNAIWYKIPLDLKITLDSRGLAEVIDLASESYQIGMNKRPDDRKAG